MKRLIFLLCLILVASSAHSQVVLLEKGQSSFFVSGGIAKAADLNGYGFAFGFTSRGKTDVGFTANSLGINNENYWDFGQFIQVYISQLKSDSTEVYFSIIESVQMISTSSRGRNEGVVLSVGGMLEAKSRISPTSSNVISMGLLWVRPGNKYVESYFVFPMQVTIAQHFEYFILSITPSLVAGQKTTTYSIGITLSIIAPKTYSR